MSDVYIGIDLGTTYTCIGLYKENGVVDILTNENGNRITPSYVAFSGKERIVGDVAKKNVGQNPRNTIYDIKRLMGKKFSDPEVRDELKHLSYKVVADSEDRPLVEVEFMEEIKQFRPEEISSMILLGMKEIAEKNLGCEVKKAVVTVPAYFNDAQRQATKTAGAIIGLDIVRIINEPTAAAIAYGLDQKNKGHDGKEKYALVFDMGGGTLDVTVLTISGGILDVRSTNGDTHLGGEDLDNRLKDYCFMNFCEKNIIPKISSDEIKKVCCLLEIESLVGIYYYGVARLEKILEGSLEEGCRKYIEALLKINRLYEDKKLMRRLKTICEDAKKVLSGCSSITVSYDNFYDGKDLSVNMTRTRFESICSKEFERSMQPVYQALKDARLTADNVDDVVLIGGSTRVPKIKEMLEKMFPGKLKCNINPDEAVACGAAIQAALLGKVSDKIIDSLVLIDVNPLSLGIETSGGLMEVMIRRNTPIPHEEKKVFSTAVDNQPAVTIKIYEGERTMTRDNNMLGSFSLNGIPPMPKGKPRIEVSFKIDTDGILTIYAKELSLGNERNIVVKNEKGRLNEQEINKMIEDAQKYQENDKMFREKIEAKNLLENYIQRIFDALNDEVFRTKIGEDKCEEISEKLNYVGDWIDGLDCTGGQETKQDIDEKKKYLEELFVPLL